MNDTGYHYILDMRLRSNAILSSGTRLRALFELALADFTVLRYEEHKFETEGAGVTGFFLLSESHCSFHTYPENNYIAVDVFKCGRDPKAAVESLVMHFDCAQQRVRSFVRGSTVIDGCLPGPHQHEIPMEFA